MKKLLSLILALSMTVMMLVTVEKIVAALLEIIFGKVSR